MPAPIRFGTSSWSERAWAGVFYGNNHYAGYAPATMEDLAGRVG